MPSRFEADEALLALVIVGTGVRARLSRGVHTRLIPGEARGVRLRIPGDLAALVKPDELGSGLGRKRADAERGMAAPPSKLVGAGGRGGMGRPTPDEELADRCASRTARARSLRLI